LEYRGRTVYHAGDSAYFPGFHEIGQRLKPELALLPIGAYHPESFRKVHMGPDQAVQAFHDLQSKWLVPMHHGTFKLSFEALDEPARWMESLSREHRLEHRVRMMEEGIPERF
jgi:L-ascorbate metabolism protein UlaG (beta-lactamase superfamily)